MSVTPRNRHDRRAAEASLNRAHSERQFDRDGLGVGGILAFPMSEVQDRLGISRSTAYEEIHAGRLCAVKCGARTLITFASAQAWLNSLPLLPA
jgi:excisionase family DNA binding protein